MRAGVQFQFNTTATRLLTEGSGAASRITDVEIINEQGRYQILSADAFVVAMGIRSTGPG